MISEENMILNVPSIKGRRAKHDIALYPHCTQFSRSGLSVGLRLQMLVAMLAGSGAMAFLALWA